MRAILAGIAVVVGAAAGCGPGSAGDDTGGGDDGGADDDGGGGGGIDAFPEDCDTADVNLRFEMPMALTETAPGIFVFVNGKLALDLGGVHGPEDGTIDFDARAGALGITTGNVYTLDVFHAERHTSQSNFRIETSIDCLVVVD